MKIDCRRL